MDDLIRVGDIVSTYREPNRLRIILWCHNTGSPGDDMRSQLLHKLPPLHAAWAPHLRGSLALYCPGDRLWI